MWARNNRTRFGSSSKNEQMLQTWRALINETWLRVRRPSCSARLTTSFFFFFFCQPGRGDSSENGFLKQLEAGQKVTWLQPRANQQPQSAQHSWTSADCLILDNPDSLTALFTMSPSLQSDICGSRADILFFFLRALGEIIIAGCEINPIFSLSLTFWHWIQQLWH